MTIDSLREKARAVAAKCYGNKLSEIEAVVLAFGKQVAEEAQAEKFDAAIELANAENVTLREKIRGLEADVFVGAKIDGDECLRLIQDLQAKLAAFTSATPDSPEVKEAMDSTSHWSNEVLSCAIRAAQAKLADQSNVIIELGAKLNATKLREEGLTAALSRAREALETLSRGECVERSCGETADRVLSTLPPLPADAKGEKSQGESK